MGSKANKLKHVDVEAIRKGKQISMIQGETLVTQVTEKGDRGCSSWDM